MHDSLPFHPSMLHPLTGQPIQALARRNDGRLAWPIMGGDDTNPPVPTPPATPPAAAAPAAPPETDPPGADALGDAGKKALDAMKTERNAARDAQRQLEADLAALKAQVDGKEAEHQAQLAAQKVQDEALAKANDRILKAEVRVAAATKLADPADALRFIDMSSFEVGDDGAVDGAAIAKAIDDLIASKPYLAAQGRRFPGSADNGPRNESNPSLDEQIAAATTAGNHALAISLKRQKAYADKT